MKYFLYFLMIATLGMMIFSVTLIDINNLFGADQSQYGLISFMISLCVLLFLVIIQRSNKVKFKYDQLKDD